MLPDMAIYEVRAEELVPVKRTTFRETGLTERHDIQRLLRCQIDALVPDCLVIAEEFSEWDDSGRRIDLLAVDKVANLVVIELKRTERGGHMELQALRYAAMISAMTFQHAVDVFERYLATTGSDEDAETKLLEHLEWDSEGDGEFNAAVRIVLASADFSKEITTTVLWLNQQGLDIQCIRLRPYAYGSQVFLDIHSVVPLKEAADYQVQLREKAQQQKSARTSSHDKTKYIVSFEENATEPLPKRHAMLHLVKGLVSRGTSPELIIEAFKIRKTSFFRTADGTLSPEQLEAHFTQAAAAGGPKFDPRYWFIDEPIFFGGRTYCLSKFWGKRAFGRMSAVEAAFREFNLKVRAAPESGGDAET